ncbi:MAG: GlcG/HbpS family heme-binding protein [Nitrospirales bacterium]
MMMTWFLFFRHSAFTGRAALILAAAFSLGAAQAPLLTDELPRESVLPLSLASKAASAAVEQCRQDGYRVSAAVVDRGGVLRVLMRGDGAGPHTTDSSTKKAYTALSLRRPTSEMAELIAKMPAIQALRDMNDQILILGGGLPIEINGEVVGGIGVGGAPGGHLDDRCAQAGLNAIAAAPQIGKEK